MEFYQPLLYNVLYGFWILVYLLLTRGRKMNNKILGAVFAKHYDEPNKICLISVAKNAPAVLYSSCCFSQIVMFHFDLQF